MSRRLADATATGHGRPVVRASTETVDATGELARTAGVTTTSDGSSASRYVGTDDRGRLYVQPLASKRGKIMRNVVLPGR